MRIGLVTGEYPPMEGGVGAFTQELARELAVIGHEIFIISSYRARPTDKKFTRKQLREPIDIGFAKLLPQTRKWTWRDARLVTDLTIRYDLDLINIQYQASAYNMRNPAINVLPWRLRGVAKTVVTFHDLREPYLFPKAGRLRRRAVNMLAQQSDGLIVTNAADHTALAPTTMPLATIPIGSNIAVQAVSAETRLKTRAQLGLADDDVLLAYFGFLNESKGADTLIDALAQLDSRHHLVFIGGQTGASDPANNSAFLNTIHAQITAHGLEARVHWTGFVEDWEVANYFGAADLTVLPYHDGVSLRRGTLMAALAFGQAIITTHPQTATPELRHGDNCWLVTAGDATALQAAVEQLIATPATRQMLRENAQKLAQAYTWDHIAQQTSDFFAGIMGS